VEAWALSAQSNRKEVDMAWAIFVMVLILALTWRQIHRRRNRGTRGMYRDYRDVGPDEMRTRVEGNMAWGDQLRDRYRRP
jgi:hypothetical protein